MSATRPDGPDRLLSTIAEAVTDELDRADTDAGAIARRILDRLEANVGSRLGELDDEETEAHEHLIAFMRIVVTRWNLQTNREELAQAIHVLQGFVIGRMLHRLAPGTWSDWYSPEPERQVGREPEAPAPREETAIGRVRLLPAWQTIDRTERSRNWADLDALDRIAVRSLVASPTVAPGDEVDVSRALADRLIGLGVAETIESEESHEVA